MVLGVLTYMGISRHYHFDVGGYRLLVRMKLRPRLTRFVVVCPACKFVCIKFANEHDVFYHKHDKVSHARLKLTEKEASEIIWKNLKGATNGI